MKAYHHGIVSRLVPEGELDDTVMEMARQIAKAPAFTVKMARRVIANLASPSRSARRCRTS